MGWEKFTKTKKGAAGPVKRESHVDGFFFTYRIHKSMLHHLL
jgi:hypothetical protein